MTENTQVPLIMGSAFLATALYWAWYRQKTGLYGLGDDPLTPPQGGDYDPRKANQAAFWRTHVAKKFWGSTVLAMQGSASLTKLSQRIRTHSPVASEEAEEIALKLWEIHQRALTKALKYNEQWVRLRMGSSGFPDRTLERDKP